MATAQHFVDRAMSRIGVKTAEINLEASEAQTGLDLLNDMLASWEVVNPQGFEPVALLTDEVRVHRFSNGAVIDNLAILIAPEFQKQISNALVATAASLRNDMRIALLDVGEVNYPSTLPLGSGNQCPDVNIDRRFFPSDEKVNF